jgi:hypothetical protein
MKVNLWWPPPKFKRGKKTSIMWVVKKLYYVLHQMCCWIKTKNVQIFVPVTAEERKSILNHLGISTMLHEYTKINFIAIHNSVIFSWSWHLGPKKERKSSEGFRLVTASTLPITASTLSSHHYLFFTILSKWW